MTFLDREVERICDSGALGRSPVYARLLRYLHTTTNAGRMPKEADIAVEVFERNEFDSSSDSFVRVYLHNLRQKLGSFYEDRPDSPEFVYIPRGEYRLAIGSRPAEPAVRPGTRRISVPLPAAAAGILAAVILVVGLFVSGWVEPPDEFAATASSGVWQPIEASDRPLVIVLGDYYIFGEAERLGVVDRLVRDFRINSADDLSAGYGEPAPEGRSYLDLQLSYLPLGTGAAMADVLSVIRSMGKDPIVIPQSSLDAKTVQSSDIVYIGYLSGLGLLREFVFASSNFELGTTFDELVRTDSGEQYVSEAGLPDGPAQDYVDYAFMSTFPGPGGNQIVVVAGMRDEGLMQMASLLSSKAAIGELLERVGEPGDPPAIEALYRVRGMNRMNIAAKLVFAAELKPRDIWNPAPGIRSAALPRPLERESKAR